MAVTDDAWVRTPRTGGCWRGTLELEQTERGVLPHRLPGWAPPSPLNQQLATVDWAQPSAYDSSCEAVRPSSGATPSGPRGHAGMAPRPAGASTC